MSAGAGTTVPSLSPLRAALRFAVLLAIVGVGIALVRWTPLGDWVDGERLIAGLEFLRAAWWTGPTLLALWLVLGAIGVPVSGFVVASGAIFGPLWGWVYNLVGALLAAAASHWLAHHLGRALIAHVLGARRTAKMESLVHTHGFWTLVRLRFVPLPFAVVNYGATLAGMPFGRFVMAAFVGLAPSIFVFTYFGAALVRAAEGDRSQLLWQFLVVMALLLALTFLPTVLRPRRDGAETSAASDGPDAETEEPPEL